MCNLAANSADCRTSVDMTAGNPERHHLCPVIGQHTDSGMPAPCRARSGDISGANTYLATIIVARRIQQQQRATPYMSLHEQQAMQAISDHSISEGLVIDKAGDTPRNENAE